MLACGFFTLAAASLALVSGEVGAANSTGRFLEPVQEGSAAAATERPEHLPEENSGCRGVHSTCDPTSDSFWQCCPGLVCVTPASGGIYCEVAATAEVNGTVGDQDIKVATVSARVVGTEPGPAVKEPEVNGTIGDQDIKVASVSARVVGTEPGPAVNKPEVLATASTGSASGSSCQYMIWHTTQEDCEYMYPRFSASYAASTWSDVGSGQSCVYASSSACLDSSRFKIVGAMFSEQCQVQGQVRGYSKACFERSPQLCYLTNGASSFEATPVNCG